MILIIIIKKLPCGGLRAESDGIIRRGAGEGAGAIVVSVAVSAWARALEELRVGAGSACVRRRVSATAAVLWIVESLARASTRHALAAAHHLELRGARRVQVHHAPRRGAVSAAGSALGLHHHRKVVTVDQAHVEEIQPAGSVQRELCQRGRRRGVTSGAFHGGGATVAGDTGEFPGVVLGAVGASPEAAGPGGWHTDDVGLAGLQSKAGGGERRGSRTG